VVVVVVGKWLAGRADSRREENVSARL